MNREDGPTQRWPVVVTGAGVISPLGDRPGEVFAALCRGDTALGPLTGIDLEALAKEGGEGAHGALRNLPALAAEIRDFDPRDYLGKQNFRPLDRTGRLATVAAQLALDASGWSAEARRRHELGLVLGTMFGSVQTIAAFDRRALTAGPIYAKPMDFANSVINAAAGQTAIWHDLRGINTTLSGGTTAGLQALGYAADLVAAGRGEAILAGGADELCFESFFGFARAGWLAGTAGLATAAADGGPGADASTVPQRPDPRPVPLDARRNGFLAAEGAALLVLESADGAAARGAAVLGEVRGHGSAFDPSRGGDDRSAQEAVERAVRLALEDAGLEPGDVNLLSLAANGSVAGDAREVRGLEAVFGERLAEVPALAVKAALGEPLGASGAFQALAALAALAEGRLPGIAGLGEVDPALPAPSVARKERTIRARTALVTALDFDGGAAALVLTAPPEGR